MQNLANKMKKPLVLFNPKLPKLSANGKKVLDLLIEAGKLVVPIYELQENSRFPGANFYPHGVSKKEVEEAAKTDPQILSPYTVVERKNGKLVAVPYHQKYAQLLKPVADKLLEAASITDNEDFSHRLKLQAKVLLDGCYEEAAIAWMTMKPYILDITIGPVERYDDKLFFTKTAYQAWVGVMDQEETARITEFKKIILSSQRKIMMPSEHVSFFDRVQARVDQTVLFSGLIAKFGFTGTNLPNEVDLMELYGSEITLFKPSLEQWFHKKHYPIFKKVFEKKFQQTYTSEGLMRGSLYNIMLHELAHSFMRYRDAELRLGNLFAIIDEIGATVMGIKACGSLLIKDVITQREMEDILVMFIARLFDWLDELKSDPSVIHYVKGNAIALNFLFSSGALKQAGGISWVNFTKMFMAIDELASVLNRIMSMANYQDAEDFINKYGDLEVFNDFKPILRGI